MKNSAVTGKERERESRTAPKKYASRHGPFRTAKEDLKAMLSKLAGEGRDSAGDFPLVSELDAAWHGAAPARVRRAAIFGDLSFELIPEGECSSAFPIEQLKDKFGITGK